MLSKIELLGEQTARESDEGFADELRITVRLLGKQLMHRTNGTPASATEDPWKVSQIGALLDRFPPVERTWCHRDLRDLHLGNIVMLGDGDCRFFDPLPTFRPADAAYLESVEPLAPLMPGHVFVDYTRLLVSLERGAIKLERTEDRLSRPRRRRAEICSSTSAQSTSKRSSISSAGPAPWILAQLWIVRDVSLPGVRLLGAPPGHGKGDAHGDESTPL